MLRGLNLLGGWGCFDSGGSRSWLSSYFLLFLLILFGVNILISQRELTLLIGFKETGNVENSFAFGEKSDFIEERDEDVDSNMGLILGKGGDEEVLVALLDEEGGSFSGSGSKDDVGEREYFSLIFLCLVCTKFVGLSWIKDFTEEHVYC